ncbi:hypothetical protein [Mesorhizobium sp. NZP2077]|uniref:hypothetical protein n=1 Tax=Mesorhizobium sp. NZP2077 TaxID=2483404 RepID=UPI00155630F7|nr:hypothetical protein [Mesorhizobium sp. NZP2077]QKD16120.1 hypothetical protein HGP13_14080 [Mesorhizobium sp. NZP2077]
MRQPLAGLAILLALGAPAMATDSDFHDCSNEKADAPLRVAACTRVMADESEAYRDHVIAYVMRASALADSGDYESRGRAWRNKGADGKAVADFSQAILLDPTNVRPFQDRGILRFYSGPIADARADLEQAARLVPDSAYFAIWVDLAERHDGSAGGLRAAEGRLDMNRWPAPVVRMMLGELTPAAVLTAADDSDPVKRTEHICEANFFAAELDAAEE